MKKILIPKKLSEKQTKTVFRRYLKNLGTYTALPDLFTRPKELGGIGLIASYILFRFIRLQEYVLKNELDENGYFYIDKNFLLKEFGITKWQLQIELKWLMENNFLSRKTTLDIRGKRTIFRVETATLVNFLRKKSGS